jgi:hypothetical protein
MRIDFEFHWNWRRLSFSTHEIVEIREGENWYGRFFQFPCGHLTVQFLERE